MNRILSIVFILMSLSACDDKFHSFKVTIVTPEGEAVQGATIQGGIDLGDYSIQTNKDGVATLPGSAQEGGATIYRTDFIPRTIPGVNPGTYTLKKTVRRLIPIGDIKGKAVRFTTNTLITLDYQSNYHLYNYTDEGVSEIFTRQLHDSAMAIRETQLSGDTLWLTTHDSGVYVFSINDPSAPEFLFHLPVSGYLGPFIVRDSLLIVSDNFNPGPVRILVYDHTGNYHELSRIQNYYVRKMKRIDDFLIFLGHNESLPTVFDISNPADPKLMYNGIEWSYRSGFFHDGFVILAPFTGSGGDNMYLTYKRIDLSDPSNPVTAGSFSSDSWVDEVASENIAYGKHYYHTQTVSVLSGNILSGFHTLATVSRNNIIEVQGAFPPYFLIGDKLWKLVER